MHEMSLALNLLDIIRQEMAKHGATRLLKVRLKYGQLATLEPAAMTFAFEAATMETDLAGAAFELEKVPLIMACSACKHEFSPDPDANLLLTPCPRCGEDFGHSIISGRELILDYLEAE